MQAIDIKFNKNLASKVNIPLTVQGGIGNVNHIIPWLRNSQSITNICYEVGILSIITNNTIIIQKSKSLILPGVESFPVAMKI